LVPMSAQLRLTVWISGWSMSDCLCAGVLEEHRILPVCRAELLIFSTISSSQVALLTSIVYLFAYWRRGKLLAL
jgi:hypothetical protein